MSGSVVGPALEAYFALHISDAGPADSMSPGEQSRYQDERGARVAGELALLVDRIRTYVDELRRAEPWLRLLQKVETEAQKPSVHLRMFEQLAYREILRQVLERGPYGYATSLAYHLGDTLVTAHLRFVFKGRVSVELLYELEDALHRSCSRSPLVADRGASAGGVVVRATEWRGHEGVLDAIRGEATRELEKRNLRCLGDGLAGALFVAGLEGPDACRARLEVPIAGRHQWARTKRAVLEALRASVPEGVTEFPAPEIPWRLVVARPAE